MIVNCWKSPGSKGVTYNFMGISSMNACENPIEIMKIVT